MGTSEMEKQIADYYGYYLQNLRCLEEMSELTRALCRFQYMVEKVGSMETAIRTSEFKNLAEELADVRIMIDQMEYLLCCEKVVESIMFDKSLRTLERMGNGKTEQKHDADG